MTRIVHLVLNVFVVAGSGEIKYLIKRILKKSLLVLNVKSGECPSSEFENYFVPNGVQQVKQLKSKKRFKVCKNKTMY